MNVLQLILDTRNITLTALIVQCILGLQYVVMIVQKYTHDLIGRFSEPTTIPLALCLASIPFVVPLFSLESPQIIDLPLKLSGAQLSQSLIVDFAKF